MLAVFVWFRPFCKCQHWSKLASTCPTGPARIAMRFSPKRTQSVAVLVTCTVAIILVVAFVRYRIRRRIDSDSADALLCRADVLVSRAFSKQPMTTFLLGDRTTAKHKARDAWRVANAPDNTSNHVRCASASLQGFLGVRATIRTLSGGIHVRP